MNIWSVVLGFETLSNHGSCRRELLLADSRGEVGVRGRHIHHVAYVRSNYTKPSANNAQLDLNVFSGDSTYLKDDHQILYLKFVLLTSSYFGGGIKYWDYEGENCNLNSDGGLESSYQVGIIARCQLSFMVCPRAANRSSRGGFVRIFRKLFHFHGFGEIALSDTTNGMLKILVLLPSMSYSVWKLTHWKRPWCWERLRAGGEGDDRGWNGWMALLIPWTWVWVSSGIWWWTGKPGMQQSVGLQRVEHDWVAELNWNDSLCSFHAPFQ